ncbi:MAG: hypothetical protein ACI84E_001723 [Planctomycetota bacterium]|jgi:hypothetical protein
MRPRTQVQTTLSSPRKAPKAWPTTSALTREARQFRAQDFEALPAVQKLFLRDLLWNDASTEYDARFLTDWVREQDAQGACFSSAFWQTHDLWAAEEQRHFEGLFAVLTGVFPEEDWRAKLADRSASFEHLESVLQDEFSILVTSAFDELVTVRAYRANLHVYGLVGPRFLDFVQLMIADEARHYARFLQRLQQDHSNRATDAKVIIRGARAISAAQPYGATFLLDHEDPEYTLKLLDSAERILVSNLA